LSFGSPAKENTKEGFRQWYANHIGDTTTSADVFTRKVTEYLGGAYRGWKAGRFSVEDGLWLNEEGGRSFKESLVIAYLAEAVRRGEYTSALAQVQQTAARHVSLLSFASSPFLGNLQELSLRLAADDARESSRLLAAIRGRDASVWRRTDLVEFAEIRGSRELLEETLKFAASVNLQTVSFPAALGMLINYYEADPENAAALERFAGLINSKVFPSIIKIKEGFFLESDPGKIDVHLSILAGKICIRAGLSGKDPVLESIGRDLIISTLNLADRQGFLPQHILAADGVLKGTQGRLAPEDVYSLIADNPYYPRFVSLRPQLGPGSWLYMTANLTGLSITPERYSFRFQFPVGATHHFVFRGAGQYTEIQIWKIPWRIDARFEHYNIGAYYLPREKLFLAKYNHKNREEEFLMSFVPERSASEAEVSPPAEETE
jgi:hypothetical protein